MELEGVWQKREVTIMKLVLDLISVCASIVVIILIFRGWKQIKKRDIKLLFFALVALNFFHNFSAILDNLRITYSLRYYENVIHIFEPMIWFFLFYAFSQEVANRNLRRSEEQFRLMIKNMPVMVCAFDEKGHIIMWNKECERVTGYSSDEIVNNTGAIELLYPDSEYRKTVSERCTKKASDFREQELGITSKDRSKKIVAWSDISGQFPISPWASWGIGINITDRKKTEEALRENQRFLSTLISNLPGMAYRCKNDRDWTMEFVSEGCLELTGYQKSDLISNKKVSYNQIIHPDDRERIWDEVQEALSKNKPFQLLYRINTALGNEKWVWEQGRGVFSEKGELLALEGFISDINDRKRAEEALKKKSDEQTLLLDNIETQVWYLKDFQTYGAVNKAHSEFLGIKKCDLEHKNIYEIFSKEDADNNISINKDVFEKKKQIRIENWTKNGKNDLRLLSITRTPILDTNRNVEYVICMAEDITERNRAELEHKAFACLVLQLAKAETLEGMSLSLAESLDNLFKWDAFVFAERLFDDQRFQCIYAVDTIKGNREVISRATLPVNAYRPLGKFLEGEPYILNRNREDELLLPRFGDESHASASLMFAPIVYSTKPVGFISVQSYQPHKYNESDLSLLKSIADAISPVFSRLRAETKLRKSEERYRLLVENINDSVVISQNEKFIFFNTRFAEMLGYEYDELLMKDYREVYTPKGVEILMKRSEKRERGEEVPARYETIFRKKDGSEIDVEANVRIIDYKGQPATFAVIRDITDRKRAEAEKAKLEAQIQHSQKLESLGILAGGIAHDFNNLLMGILGNASLALMNLSATSPIRDTIEQIEKASQRAADLTRKMLDYSGKGKFVAQSINLSELIKEVTPLLMASISKKIILNYNLKDDLPSIEADESQIRQVVMNLIINASEAIADRSGIITVNTGVKICDCQYLSKTFLDDSLPEGSYVYLEVIDTGIGMDADTLSKIFDPFFTTKFTGRGLGLAVVLGIVRGHKGAIEVQSEPGNGAMFRVLFPSSDKIFEQTNVDRDAPLEWRGKGTILIVDDEEIVRTVTKKILEQFGFTILTAKDGYKGVEVFKKYSKDVIMVLLDLTMPYMSGEEAFQKMQKIKSDVQVILSSGYNEQEATNRFEGKGLAGFIQKPYRPNDLIAKIRQVLNK